MMNKVAFIALVRRRLAPRLRRGDIVVLDNLPAHKAPEVQFFIEQRGATVKRLPPYSHDFQSHRAGVVSLVKRRMRDYAPRTAPALRRVARAARYAVTPYHCRQYFRHAGYVNSSTRRD